MNNLFSSNSFHSIKSTKFATKFSKIITDLTQIMQHFFAISFQKLNLIFPESSFQKTEKSEKSSVKKKTSKADKDKSYELPEIPDYERAVLEKPQEFDFGEYQPRDKSKLERPTTVVSKFIFYYYATKFFYFYYMFKSRKFIKIYVFEFLVSSNIC